MNVLLDEQIDWRLRRMFAPEFTVSTVVNEGWSGMRNGALLRAAAERFDVFVTMDRGLEYQQNLDTIAIAVVVIAARSNRLVDVQSAMPTLNRLLGTLRPGKVFRIVA